MKKRAYIGCLLIMLLTVCMVLTSCGTKKTEKTSNKNKTDQTADLPADQNGDTDYFDLFDQTGSDDQNDGFSGGNGGSNDYSYSGSGSGTGSSGSGTGSASGSGTGGTGGADIPAEEEAEYSSPISRDGKDVGKSPARTVNVKTNNVVYKDFMSLGANVFPGIITAEGKAATGMNDVFFEIERKRYVSAKPQFTRFLFNVDYMVTNVETDPGRSDWQNNRDYINYKNGVYDFDGERMQAVYRYLDILKEGGGKVYINFGWKSAERIWSWFCLDDAIPSNSAPRETPLFAKACAALIKELYNRGYTNIIGVSIYNEPNGGDFRTIGSKPAYFVSVMKQIDSELKKVGMRDKIALIGPEASNLRVNNHSFLDYLNTNIGSLIGGYNGHNYYTLNPNATAGETESINYDYNYSLGVFLRGTFKKPIYFSEMDTGTYELKEIPEDKRSDEIREWSWQTSTASYLISCANSGVSGACRWSYSGQFWTDPLGYGSFNNNYQSLYLCATSLDNIRNGVLDKYYEDSILTNYVKAGSSVLMVDWTGTDTRVSAFRLPDGNYTVVVEVNDSSAERNLTINFDRSIGKNFYRMSFTHDVKNDGNATVPRCDKTFSGVTTSLKDTLNKKYTCYVYTTCKPIKQIELQSVTATLKAGEKFTFKPTLIDCEKSDSVEWTISAQEGGHPGKIENGVYTAASDAKPGDLIAVRASLKSDKKIFAVAVIEIK